MTGRGRTPRSTGRVVAEVVLAELLVIALAAAVVAASGPLLALGAFSTVVLLALALALAGLLPDIHVELRRHATAITAGDALLVLGLALLPPFGFVVAVGLAELATTLRLRGQPRLKRGYNLATMLTGAAVGAAVAATVGVGDPLEPRTWLAIGLGTVAVLLVDALAMAAVLAGTEQARYLGALRDIAVPLGVGLLLAVPLGITALLVLAAAGPAALVLVAPVLALLQLSAHAVGVQRQQRVRLQRLHDATAALTPLAPPEQLLARIADGARAVLTGSAAVAVHEHRDDAARAVLVDDRGTHLLPPPGVQAVATLRGSASRGSLPATHAPGQLRAVLPGTTHLCWSAQPTEDAGLLTAVVAREPHEPHGDDHRDEVLGTYLLHAATALHTAELHAALAEALSQERALGERQSDFVAAVTHELLTPLTGIAGALELLGEDHDRVPDDTRRQLLDLARRHTRRLHRLVEEVLLVAASERRAIELRPREVTVDELLSGLAEQLPPEADARLTITTDGDQPPLWTDPQLLIRVLTTLVDNAVKYAPDGPIELTLGAGGDVRVLAVRDHGPGIATQDHDRIFDRFTQADQTTTRVQGGTGLGLYLAAQLTTALGGQLRLDPTLEDGTRFVIELPDDAPPACP